MICTVVANHGKFTTVLEGKIVGTSKHQDFSAFHWKAKDVAYLKKPITQFAFVNDANEITELILTADMKDRGQNFKSARREPVSSLNDVERAEINAAIELVRSAPTEPPKKAAAPADKPTDAPKAFITEAAAAVGIPEATARAAEAQAEAQPPAANDAQPEVDPDPDPEDPQATVKPSRINNKKKRR